MSSTLSEGVRVPDIGSVNWGADVNFNWGLLNTALANISGNVKTDVANTWTATQTFTETISGSIDGVAARAVNDEDGNNIKTALAGKQPSLSQSQLAAVNSGVTAAAVQQIADNATAISGKQDKLSTAQQAAVDSGATAAKIDQIAANASAIVSLTSSKQEQLSTTQLAAVNSGVTAAAVQQIGTNASNISGLQTAVASKAADSEVVHLAGAETISGDKTFTGTTVTHNLTPETDNTYSLGTISKRWTDLYASKNISIYEHGLTFGVTPATSAYFGFRYYDNTGNVYGDMLFNANSNGSNYLRLRCRNTDGTNTYDRQISLFVLQNGITQFIPNASGVFDLGLATRKWKTLNGINPGALCLQNFNAGITLDTTNWDKTGKFGADANFWTPTVNGWLTVLVNGTPGAGWVQLSQGDSLGQFSVCLSTGYAWATIPVIANWQCKICLLCSTVSAKFYPCLGNV